MSHQPFTLRGGRPGLTLADVRRPSRPRSGASRRTRRSRTRLLGAVQARRHLGGRPRPRDVLVGTGLTVNYGELELIGLQDNPPMVMQDPPAHTEFPATRVARVHPRQVEAVNPPYGTSSSTASNGCGRRAVGTSSRSCSPLPSMVVAHYLGFHRPTGRSSTAGPTRSWRRAPNQADCSAPPLR